MKKAVSIILAAILIVSLAACSSGEETQKQVEISKAQQSVVYSICSLNKIRLKSL